MQTVIAIDDDPNILELIEFELKQGGFKVILAKNGSEAIDRVKATPDAALIILDLDMPLMNGHEVLNELRIGGYLNRAPILVLSANPYDVHLDEVTMILPKPFKLPELNQAVSAAILHFKKEKNHA